MKAIILLEMENGKRSVVIVEQDNLCGKDVHSFRARLAATPEVHSASIMLENIDGRIVTAEQYDSAESLAGIASWM